MKQSTTVLLIEDDPAICEIVSMQLESEGWRVILTHNLKDGERELRNHIPDLVLLDLGLPDGDGLTFLLHNREWYSRPIIIISARDSEESVVSGLERGAVDYLVKPFGLKELTARIKMHLSLWHSRNGEPASSVKTVGPFEIDFDRHTVQRNGEEIRLTPIEFRMIELLIHRLCHVVPQRELLDTVWGPGHRYDTHYLRIFVSTLRRKIEPNPQNPLFLITEKGIGYRFMP